MLAMPSDTDVIDRRHGVNINDLGIAKFQKSNHGSTRSNSGNGGSRNRSDNIHGRVKVDDVENRRDTIS